MSLGAHALAALTQRRNARTRRQSSYDTTGGNRDYRDVPVGDTLTLARMAGAGCITHLWFTINCPDDRYYLRHLVLRMYWDGEDHPSVECPVGDFFNIGHGISATNSTLPFVTVAPKECERKLGGNMAMNCYWQMPFGDGARITVTNEGTAAVHSFYYYVDYEEHDSLPEGTLRFHAQWRRENPTQGIMGDLSAQGLNYWMMQDPNTGEDVKNLDGKENFVILEAEGAGHYVGCNLSIDNIDPTPDGLTWWGEGDDMFYIDGEEMPSMTGTGSEDYFCQAWGMHAHASPYAGTSLSEYDTERPGRRKCTNYRFHVTDPVIFNTVLKVSIEHGHANLQSNDYSSTAYWYQTEPHKPFPPLPPAVQRRPRPDR